MLEDLPLVCICIPTYNAAASIRETLESILSQTYANLVIHVSDNASTDGTLEAIATVADPRLIIHRHLENVGGEGNFNRCIQLSEGKYTAIFHADDVYEPDIVAKQVAFLEGNPVAGAVFTEASLIDDVGNRIGSIQMPVGIVSNGGLYDFPTMFKAVLRHSNFFICPSFMVRTQIYRQEIQAWRGTEFGSSADLDVWLRILRNHPIGHLAERLMRYRISSNQFTARIRLETERAMIFKVLDHYRAQPAVAAMLSPEDVRNCERLERRDRMMRAVNLFLSSRPRESGPLLRDIYSRDALRAALQSKRGLLVLVVGTYVRLLATLRLNRFGKATLHYMKQATRR